MYSGTLAKFSLTRAGQVAIPIVVLGFAGVEAGRRSITESPDNPKYWAQRAAEAEDRNESPVAALIRAVELAPREAIYASRLGLAHEAEGELVLAEFALRRGAELSRKYEPQWNLLNFFFRRGRWEEFWAQAATTLAISYGDRAALFDLCTRADGGADRLERILPTSHNFRFSYAAFLMSRGEYAHAGPFVEGVANSATMDDVPALRAWRDALLANLEVAFALRAWNNLRTRGLVDEEALPWLAARVAGVTQHQLANDKQGNSSWQILLSGEQPEQCTLLSRVFAAGAGTSRLEWTLDAELSAASGLSWQVENFRKPRLVARSDDLRSGNGALEFVAMEREVFITLQFRRPLGSVRAEGRVTIKDLRVTERRP